MNVQDLMNQSGSNSLDGLVSTDTSVPEVIDADTVKQNNKRFRIADINAPEVVPQDVVDDRIARAQQSPTGESVSLANAGEVAKLNAQLGTLDPSTSITKGFGDIAQSFDDSQATPQTVDYGRENLFTNPYLPKDKFNRTLTTNDEYAEKAIETGNAVPFMDGGRSDRLELALDAKTERLGLWGTRAEAMQKTADKSGILPEPVDNQGRLEADWRNTSASIISTVAGALDAGVDFARNAYGKENIDNAFEKAFFKNDFLNSLKDSDTAKEITGASQKYLKRAEKDLDKKLEQGDYLGALMSAGLNTDVYLSESAGEMALLSGKIPGLMLAVGNRVNNDIETYKKEHKGQSPDSTRIGQMIATNTAVLGAEQLLVFKPFKKIMDKIKTGKSTVTGAVGGVVASGVGEGLQEVADTAQQEYNTKDKIISEDDAIKSFVAGAAIGGTLRGSVETLSAAQGGAIYAKEKYDKNQLDKNISQVFDNTSSADDLNFKVDIEEAGIESSESKLKEYTDLNTMVQDTNSFEELAGILSDPEFDQTVVQQAVAPVLEAKNEANTIYFQAIESIYNSDPTEFEASKEDFKDYITQNFEGNSRVDVIKKEFNINDVESVSDVVDGFNQQQLSQVFSISTDGNTDISKSFIEDYQSDSDGNPEISRLKNQADNILSGSTDAFKEFKKNYADSTSDINKVMTKAINQAKKKVEYGKKVTPKKSADASVVANQVDRKQSSKEIFTGVKGIIKDYKSKKKLREYLDKFDDNTLEGVGKQFQVGTIGGNKVSELVGSVLDDISTSRSEGDFAANVSGTRIQNVADGINRDIKAKADPKKAKSVMYDLLKSKVEFKEDTEAIANLINYVKDNGLITDKQAITAIKRLEKNSENKVKPEPVKEDPVESKDFLDENQKESIKKSNPSVREQFTKDDENIEDTDRSVNKAKEDGYIDTKVLSKDEVNSFLQKEGITGYKLC